MRGNLYRLPLPDRPNLPHEDMWLPASVRRLHTTWPVAIQPWQVPPKPDAEAERERNIPSRIR
jgi:hypothetical protein